MSIDYQALKQIVDNARFECGEEFSYLGVDFLLFPGKYSERERRINASPAFYQPSSLANWDIYLAVDVINEEFRKPILLHEILEAEQLVTLRKEGMNRQEARNQAHKTARTYDDKYAKEVLDNQTYERYCQFRQEWLNGSV